MEFVVILLIGLAVWVWIGFAGVRGRERALRSELDTLRARQGDLAGQQQLLQGRVDALAGSTATAAAAPAPEPEPVPEEAPLSTTVVVPVPAAAYPPPPTSAGAISPAAPPPPPRPSTPAAAAPEPAPGQDASGPAAEVPAPPIPAARPPFQLPAVLRQIDWEQLVGVKLFSVVAGLAVAVAAVLFASWSVEHGIVTPLVRFAIGAISGLALVVVSELRWSQRYRITMQALAAGGIAALFSTFFAAHARWHLIPSWAAFALLALVAVVAVGLAVRRDALVVAVLGLLGGFATPFLVSTGENRPLGLFGYLLLLNVGLAWVSHRKRWPLLSALSLLFTAVYQAGWVARFLDGAQLPLALGIFLVFPFVGFAGLALAHRIGAADRAPSPVARWTAAAGALPPALLALYVAGSGGFGAQWPLLLGFLALIAAGLAVVAAWQGPEWLHLAGAGAVLVTLAAFLARSFDGSAWPALAGFLALFVAIYLGVPLLLARFGRDFRGDGRLGALAAPLVLAAFAVVAHSAAGHAPGWFFAPLLLSTAACAGFAVLRADARVHLLASALALAGEASWSASHLEAGTLYPALLAYAAFAALFLGAPLLADRRGRPMTGAPAGPLLLASLAMLAFVAHAPAAGAAVGSLAGLTVLAALFQAALFCEAARGRSPLLALSGVLIGFLVLGLWALTALAAALLPGLLAGAALAGVALAGALLAGHSQRDPQVAGAFRAAPHLALAGHLLVLAVAAHRDLAIPAAPWLAVLGVLDLGFLAAALLRRRGDLLVGAAAASVLVLVGHELGLGLEAPSPAVGGWAALAVAALFLAGFLAARRVGAAPAQGLGSAGVAALVALHGGQVVLLLSALGSDALPVHFLLPAHLALGAGALALAWLAPAEAVALSSAVLGALAAPLVRVNGGAGAGEALALATGVWLLALAYPLLRGARGRAERFPFLAAVVASAAYLLLARRPLVDLGAGPYLGALPVVQGLLLVPHLVLLRRLEPPSARERGRLALVAAAVLGLATVAIPLQLDKQWWTIGWALQAAALAWLWRRLRHPGLLAWSAALLAASFVRLVPFLNVWIFDYHRRGQTPLWNWYLYAYAAVAGAHFLAAWFLAGGEDRIRPRWPRLSTLASAGGALLLFFLVNVEIADLWSEGERITFRFSAGLAPDLTYTIAWAIFAVALLSAGVLLRSRGARVAAIGLLAATVLKAFLHDLSRLSGLYRIGSFVGLAVSLALVALVLQRFVLRTEPRPPEPPPSPPEPP